MNGIWAKWCVFDDCVSVYLTSNDMTIDGRIDKVVASQAEGCRVDSRLMLH